MFCVKENKPLLLSVCSSSCWESEMTVCEQSCIWFMGQNEGRHHCSGSFSELTLTFLGKHRFTDLSIADVLLHFIRSFVPAEKKKHARPIDPVDNTCNFRCICERPELEMTARFWLTGSGRLHLPTSAHSLFPSRCGYTGVALAGTLWKKQSHNT